MSTTRSCRTRVLTGVAAGTAALTLAACGSSSGGGVTSAAAKSSTTSTTGASNASNLPKTLVFSPLSLKPPALRQLAQGVQGYAGSQGWKVVLQEANFDPSTQVQQLNAVISNGTVGAAWVLAVAPTSMGSLLKTAQSKGIPILVNGKPDEYGYSGAQPGITFDYIDYAASGKSLGQQGANCVTKKLGGNAHVLWIQSQQGTAGKADFDGATKSALQAGAPKAQIVQTLIESDRTKAQTDVSAALQGHPEINAVVAANDEGALGALGAFAAAGKTLPCVADFGGNAEVLKDVQSGQIFASVALQLQADLKQSFDTLVKMQADPKAKGLVLTVPVKTFTANG